MLTPRTYPQSPVVNRNVALLLERGFQVDLVHVSPNAGAGWRPPEHPRLRRYQVPVRHRRSRAAWYLYEYGVFFAAAAMIATVLGLRHRYAAIQVDNLPDSLVFAALVPRLRGAPVLLNIVDPMPELTAVRLGLASDHPVVRVARAIERASTAWADAVTVPNDTPCRLLVMGRGTPSAKVHVIPNTLPVTLIEPRVKPAPPVMVYLGTLLERYGVAVGIDAFARLRCRWPDLVLTVIGTGEHEDRFRRRAQALGVDGQVRFRGFLPWPEAMREVRLATVGIVPLLDDGYGELMTPTKLFDFIQQGVPAVCSRLPGIETFFPEDSVVYCRPGDADSLAEAVESVLCDPEAAVATARRAQLALERISWENVAHDYLRVLGVAGG